MPHHLDLFLPGDSVLHRADVRAKLVAFAGVVAGVLAAPTRPLWPTAGLLGLLLAMAGAGRLPARAIARRLLAIGWVILLPLALAFSGSDHRRLAAEALAAKSVLIALACAILLATTRAVDLLAVVARLPLLAHLGQLVEFTFRGADLLAEEVLSTNRAWVLRAPQAGLALRLRGLGRASVSLMARAAARAERVGAAMVLRGFRGQLPAADLSPVPWPQMAAAAAMAAFAVSVAVLGRWS